MPSQDTLQPSEDTRSSAKKTPASAGSKWKMPLLLTALVAIGAFAINSNLRYQQERPARAHIQKAITAIQSKKAQEAETELRAAITLRPDIVEPYVLLARVYMDTQRPDKAIPLYARLRQIAPKTEHITCGLAEAYARAGNDKQATEIARQATTIEPNCSNAHAILGMALGIQLETKLALIELNKAHSLDPSNVKITMSLAQAYLDSNDADSAERLAREVIAKDPSYPTAYYTLGRAYARRNPTPENLKQGIAAFEKTTQLKPEWGDAFSELGRLRLQNGDTKGSIQALEYLWKRGVRTEESTFNLSKAYRKAGDVKRAEALTKEFKRLSDFYAKYDALRKRLALDPNNVDNSLAVGECEVELKNWADAELLLQGVLRARPKDPRALKAIVRLYEGKGDKPQAEAYKARLISGENRQP